MDHQATLSVDGRVVATQTTSFTPSNFDISASATPGTTHTISVNVKGRGALKNPSNGRYVVPDAAEWSEAVPQGIYRSAFLRVYPAVRISDAFVRTSVANQSLTYDVSVANTSGSARTVTLGGTLASDNGTTFTYPSLPTRTVTVAAHSAAKVTVGPVAWPLGGTPAHRLKVGERRAGVTACCSTPSTTPSVKRVSVDGTPAWPWMPVKSARRTTGPSARCAVCRVANRVRSRGTRRSRRQGPARSR